MWISVTPFEKFELPAAKISRQFRSDILGAVDRSIHTLSILFIFFVRFFLFSHVVYTSACPSLTSVSFMLMSSKSASNKMPRHLPYLPLSIDFKYISPF